MECQESILQTLHLQVALPLGKEHARQLEFSQVGLDGVAGDPRQFTDQLSSMAFELAL